MDEEEARAFLALLEGLYQDNVIMMAEANLDAVEPFMEIPSPNTCHPAFSHQMQFVREFNKDLVKVSRVSRQLHFPEEQPYPTAVDLPTYTVLRRVKAYGRAPFVGDPRLNEAIYTWSIWMDSLGRHISGDSKLLWRY